VLRACGFLVLVIAGTLAAPVVQAYNAEGHRIVGHIAERFICPQTRQALMELLPPGEYSLADAGTWADEIRSDSAWDMARPWHYINVPDGQMVSSVPRREAGDILSALERFSAELAAADTTPADRQVALYFVVHFVGDVHQPLHVGRRDDLGGNRVDIEAEGVRTNLHVYWDGAVWADVLQSPVGAAARLANRYGRYTEQWQQTDYWAWAAESLAFRPEVYQLGGPDPQGAFHLNGEYQQRALQISEFRLAQAGVRLAGLLDSIFCIAADPAD